MFEAMRLMYVGKRGQGLQFLRGIGKEVNLWRLCPVTAALDNEMASQGEMLSGLKGVKSISSRYYLVVHSQSR